MSDIIVYNVNYILTIFIAKTNINVIGEVSVINSDQKDMRIKCYKSINRLRDAFAVKKSIYFSYEYFNHH